MTFAHVANGAVDAFGAPPKLALVDGEWVDLRTLEPAKLAAAGWFPLVRVDRPADTTSTTWDRGYTFDGSTVTVTWTERAKTQSELDAEAEAENRETIEAAVTSTLSGLAQVIGLGDTGIMNNAPEIIRTLARNQRRIIRYQFGQLDGSD